MTTFSGPEPTIDELRAVNERLVLTSLREQAAREAAERLTAGYAALLAQFSEGVIIVDPAGRISYVNAAACRLDSALQPGLSLAAAAVNEASSAESQTHRFAALPVCRALRGETVAGIECRIRSAAGAEMTVRSSSSPLLADDGRLLGALIRLQEIPALQAGQDVEAAPDFQVGDLAICYRTKQVTLKGQLVKLSPIEYQLLYRLARNAGRILPVQTLLDRIWGTTVTAYTDYVKIYVHRLRTKIETKGGPRYIETVRGLGYRFMGPPAATA